MASKRSRRVLDTVLLERRPNSFRATLPSERVEPSTEESRVESSSVSGMVHSCRIQKRERILASLERESRRFPSRESSRIFEIITEDVRA